MTRRSRPSVGAVVAVVLAVSLVAGCGNDDSAATGEPTDSVDIAVTGASIALPAGRNTAIYFDIANEGADDVQIVEVRTELGSSTEVHETRESDDGLMRMHPVESVDIAAGEVVSFRPGGLHVMVFDVEDLAEGDTAPVELVFESGAITIIEAEVRSHVDLLEE